MKSSLSLGYSFRLIFVMFFLYLMGDALYRWDGFSYSASFFEFMPGVALISVLWCIAAVLTSILIWLPFKAFEWSCQRMGWKISAENLLIFFCCFVIMGTIIWVSKRFFFVDGTTLLQKFAVFLCLILATSFLTWILRGKLNIICERLSPLVWLFGSIVIISVPLVAYHTWFKEVDNVISIDSSRLLSADDDRPNIILLTFDALSARNMSLYGYTRPTTPYISEWAKKASLFTRTEAESNLTTPTMASLFTGKRLWTHQTYGVASASKPVNSRIENLALILKKNGYYNMSFISNKKANTKKLDIYESFDINVEAIDLTLTNSFWDVPELILYRLFDNKIHLYNWILKHDFALKMILAKTSNDYYETLTPPKLVFENFFLNVNNNRPFFAWIHIFPPHDPYLPPEPYKGAFNTSIKLRAHQVQEMLVRESFKYLYEHKPYPVKMQPSVDLMRDYYDEYIMYIDNEFKYFIEELNKTKIGNTIIILSADHGESFEHDYFNHAGPFLYEQVTHIPLIIKEPGQLKGQLVDTLVEQIDIPATILDLANIPVPSWMEGRSLLPLMRGRELSQKPIYSMNFEGNPSRGNEITKGTIAVWEGDYKLIHYLEQNRSLLFNLNEDYGELNNIIGEEPEIGQHLLNLIRDNLESANENIKKSN